MGFYWIKTNRFIKFLFKQYHWDIPNNQKEIFLTFDDGPTPAITEWVLDVLKTHNIQATFFCIGKNIHSNPSLFTRIKEEQHAIGNHTFNHTNGWKTTTDLYLNNISICQSILKKNNIKSKLFRPPYGKITRSQASILQKKGYKIIMWDVLSADFDQTISPKKCLENVIKNVKTGSIIVFHDSIKASTNLKYALPKAIEFLKEQQYSFKTIQ
ncbi:polysaccharide deacetylase family protein [Flavobacterium agrisoli]|uniref:Polysaccharide deacetylase family protein n=1 Tax=Flavobacterium agrisoli TaxID=2793066 RepID=A0A934UKK2_9FLAO|nr:polysaccharide deacetylase family protein [Flavobacterium agrisoli]MBK0370530.1 polysaccharide deacetylase family protein [Flavobacterium agrisoli]